MRARLTEKVQGRLASMILISVMHRVELNQHMQRAQAHTAVFSTEAPNGGNGLGMGLPTSIKPMRPQRPRHDLYRGRLHTH